MEYKTKGNILKVSVCFLHEETLRTFPIIPPHKQLERVGHARDLSWRKQKSSAAVDRLVPEPGTEDGALEEELELRAAPGCGPQTQPVHHPGSC